MFLMMYNFMSYIPFNFYPTALKGCRGIVFTHGVHGRRREEVLPGLYLRNRKV